MKVAIFSTHEFEKAYLEKANAGQLDLHFFEEKLNPKTAILAKGYDVIARLITFPNVLITSHQSFLTDTALMNIAETTISNLIGFRQGLSLENTLSID